MWFLGMRVTSPMWFPRVGTVPASTWSSGVGSSPSSAWFSRTVHRWREPDWLDSPPLQSPTLSSLLSRSSWSLLWGLFLASNSKSLTSLRNRSTSRSLSSNCPCPVAPDTVRSVWYNPSPRPDCSSSHSRSLSSRLFLSSFLLCGPPRGPNGFALGVVSRTSFRHFPFAWVPAEPQLCRRFP